MQDQNAKEKALQSISSMSSAQIVSATAIHSKLLPGIVRASFPANAQVILAHTRAYIHTYIHTQMCCIYSLWINTGSRGWIEIKQSEVAVHKKHAEIALHAWFAFSVQCINVHVCTSSCGRGWFLEDSPAPPQKSESQSPYTFSSNFTCFRFCPCLHNCKLSCILCPFVVKWNNSDWSAGVG